jgi:hypothetical protein
LDVRALEKFVEVFSKVWLLTTGKNINLNLEIRYIKSTLKIQPVGGKKGVL